MSTAFQLLDLKVHLESLPSLSRELPLPDDARNSDYAEFLPPFEILTPVLQRVGGDVAEAVAETIHVAFFMNGKVVITERGPAACAVEDVLMTYLEKYPKHPSLKKWVKRIGDVARQMGIVTMNPNS